MINELESLRAFPPGNATAATTTLAADGPPQIGVGPQQSAPAATVASLTGKPAGHCSDISARPRGGGGGHGHNEDWPGPIRAFWYLASYTALPGADFSSCAGVVYPGGLVGWAWPRPQP